MSNPIVVHRAIAILKQPRPVAEFINSARVIVLGMTGNPNFPSPVPALAAVQAGIDELVDAAALATSLARGTAAARNAKRAALVSLLEMECKYVQNVADSNPENGAAIILEAGLALRKRPVLPPREFSAKRGRVSGSVKIVAPAAARRASYEWQMSTDGGKTWQDLEPTLASRTQVSGLTPLTTVWFRYRALTKAGRGDWSQPTSVVVL